MPYVVGQGQQKTSSLPAVQDVFHSPNVYANFVNIALWNDPQGPEAATLAAVNSPTYVFETVTQEATEGEFTDQPAVEAAQRKLVEQGFITQSDLDKGAAAGASPAASDPTPGVVNTGTTATGAALIGADVDATVLYDYGNGKLITIKDVTKIPGVVFPYDVATIAPQNGLTVQEVCDNLKALITNVWVPLKNEFPDAFITCSFRKGGVGSPTSQHPRGMAMDIQYSKASKSDYYTRALWIRDNIPYDQFILEYKTTGSGNPWHHISFDRAGNRGQVCTFMNDKNCKGPGVQGLFDLSNA